MNRWLKILIITIIVAVLGYMLYSIVTTLQEKTKAVQQRQQIPSFKYRELDSTVYQSTQLPPDRPTVIIYFNPECGDCQYQWKVLRKNHQKLKDLYFVLVSSTSMTSLQNFHEQEKIDQYENIKLLFDEKDQFFKDFGTRHYPTLFIYNQSRQLVQTYEGETKVEAILRPLSAGS